MLPDSGILRDPLRVTTEQGVEYWIFGIFGGFFRVVAWQRGLNIGFLGFFGDPLALMKIRRVKYPILGYSSGCPAICGLFMDLKVPPPPQPPTLPLHLQFHNPQITRVKDLWLDWRLLDTVSRWIPEEGGWGEGGRVGGDES